MATNNPPATTRPATVHPYPPNISDPPATSPLFSGIDVEALICKGAITFCIILALVLFAIYIITSYTISKFPHFYISGASLAPLDSATAAARWNLVLETENINAKYKIHYGEFNVSVFYSGDDIEFVGTKLSPFVQPEESATLLFAELSVSSNNVGPNILRKIVRDQTSGWLGLWVRITVKIEMDDKKVLVIASCYDLKIRFESGSNGFGVLTGHLPKKCVLEKM